jgi:hypothetical protein
VSGGKWSEENHTDIFGHQSSIFPHSFQNCSGNYRNIRWDFPSPGGRRRRSAPEAISGPHPTHRTAPTRPPWTFTCLANWKNMPEAGDFHLTTPSKPSSRNGQRPTQYWHNDLTTAAGLQRFRCKLGCQWGLHAHDRNYTTRTSQLSVHSAVPLAFSSSRKCHWATGRRACLFFHAVCTSVLVSLLQRLACNITVSSTHGPSARINTVHWCGRK